jgi:hypothetical protein
MATRHERRRKAKAIAEARARKSIVAANLAKPVERQFIRGRLVSGVYSGEQDRARGMGVTPMTHKVQRVLSSSPYAGALGSGAKNTGTSWRV